MAYIQSASLLGSTSVLGSFAARVVLVATKTKLVATKTILTPQQLPHSRCIPVKTRRMRIVKPYSGKKFAGCTMLR